LIYLEKFIEQFTDEELEKCFIEIYEWRKVGVLPTDALTRKAWNDYKKQSQNESFPIHAMPEAIFFEICKRKYREDGINV